MNNAIDLRQFRYFLAVSEERHFGRAAQRLHISQPPLSRQIRQLEEQLGVALFVRNASGVVLTLAGEKFLPEVKRTLAQAEKAIAAARSAQDAAQGKLVIGYTTVFDRSVFPDVFNRFQQRFPNWQLITTGNHSINLVRSIRNGVMDVAFIGLHTEVEGLESEVVHQEEMVVALPAKHPLARKRKISFNELNEEAMFWFERSLNPGFYDYCQTFFNRIAFRPRMLPEPPDHHILLGLIAEGKGFALIPSSLKNIKRQGVVFRELKPATDTFSIGISLVFLKSNPSPALQSFLTMVRNEL
ncbi:LysR family transcriptional regulator [Pantoea sp. At-9b]|uniref:LysR family transcriptional regulator n=1 Tax=Pantoea sp. (strain At-9b) TaxID=592316 RepID=UPI0001B3EE1F|nr:LysR family transcriptional regulator [Pantoea sp. At-9b]ADU72016.1 transcriptional regulator, LysR family [Pantoea sp. At-9b]